MSLNYVCMYVRILYLHVYIHSVALDNTMQKQKTTYVPPVEMGQYRHSKSIDASCPKYVSRYCDTSLIEFKA